MKSIRAGDQSARGLSALQPQYNEVHVPTHSVLLQTGRMWGFFFGAASSSYRGSILNTREKINDSLAGVFTQQDPDGRDGGCD